MSDIKIKTVNVQERCEVCHQSDMFDVETQFCGRCQHIALISASREEKVNAAPLPEFLVRRLSSNTPIRCRNCNQFIMSRDASCRHCGTYVRFEESAEAVQAERFLADSFEQLNSCKSAAGVSWDFLKFHFWFFPLLILTPITAIASFVLFLRTLWFSSRCGIRIYKFLSINDKRINESFRDLKLAVVKSGGAFLITATLGIVVAYSGLMALPMFWDNYAKGQREFTVRNFEDAEKLFAKALENNPDNLDAHIYYARSIWNQYINDSNADKERNKIFLDRSVGEFRLILQKTKDLNRKNEVYLELANIYKTTGDREEYEQWLLARARMLEQTPRNQSDSYMKLALAYANDVTDLMQIYIVKERVGRTYHPVKSWKTEDIEKLQNSAKKALNYLGEGLAIDPQNEQINSLQFNLYREFEKIRLKIIENGEGKDKTYQFSF
ncbi:MAG: tetratricopeptide repeat protein [Blastocatellia bacterium]|nr:tetratricopeptide repeat protein [Blastocatellia bacterium]